jgi:hypothetical protein
LEPQDKSNAPFDGRMIGVIDEVVLRRLLQPQIDVMQAQITDALQVIERRRLS